MWIYDIKYIRKKRDGKQEIGEAEHVTKLNTLGIDGWEICDVQRHEWKSNAGHTQVEYIYHLKKWIAD